MCRFRYTLVAVVSCSAL